MKIFVILIYLVIFLVKMIGILFYKLGDMMDYIEIKLELLCDWVMNV